MSTGHSGFPFLLALSIFFFKPLSAFFSCLQGSLPHSEITVKGITGQDYRARAKGASVVNWTSPFTHHLCSQTFFAFDFGNSPCFSWLVLFLPRGDWIPPQPTCRWQEKWICPWGGGAGVLCAISLLTLLEWLSWCPLAFASCSPVCHLPCTKVLMLCPWFEAFLLILREQFTELCGLVPWHTLWGCDKERVSPSVSLSPVDGWFFWSLHPSIYWGSTVCL